MKDQAVNGWLGTGALLLIITTLWFLAGDPPKVDQKEKDRIDIKENSNIVRICKNATAIYRYKDRYWVKAPNIDAAWLDPQTPQEKFCE